MKKTDILEELISYFENTDNIWVLNKLKDLKSGTVIDTNK
jgi:hypothetical protein